MSHKKIQEDVARRDYSESQDKLTFEKNKLKNMQEILQNAYLRSHSLHSAGGAISTDLVAIDCYVDGQRKVIESQRSIINGLNAITEDKREILIEAAKECKVFNKLKEKKFKEHKKLEKKLEIKQIDELNVMYSKRGRAYE